MEPLLLTCMAIAYFITKGKVDSTAYANGHEAPGVAKARLDSDRKRRRNTDADPKPKKPKGPLRQLASDRWWNACENVRQRVNHNGERRREWYERTAPEKDEKWRKKHLRRMEKAAAAADRWASRRGIIDLDAVRARKKAAKARSNTRETPTPETTAPKSPTETSAPPPHGSATEPSATSGSSTGEGVGSPGEEPTRDGDRATGTAQGDRARHEGPPPRTASPHKNEPSASETPPGRARSQVQQNTGASKKPSAQGTVSIREHPTARKREVSMSYISAVTRLVQAADRCTQYEFALRTLADGLDVQEWGAEIHGAIRDMATEMGRAASAFRDVASTMRREGDNVAGAHEAHPYVPTNPTVIFA